MVTKGWTSEEFSFKKGVYQGDRLSPIVFLLAFNPIREKLCSYSGEKGYNLSGFQIITTLFSDDFILCTTKHCTHQKLINGISSWTKSLNL